MHIATGITLRNRDSGGHWKIMEVAHGVVTLTDDSGRAVLNITAGTMAERFEEFGPEYEDVQANLDGGAAPPVVVTLQRCAHCGSTHLDASAWLSDRDTDDHGPGCMDCGATTESVDLWNTRVRVFDAAACRQSWENTYHKVRAEISYERWEYVWRKATGAA